MEQFENAERYNFADVLEEIKNLFGYLENAWEDKERAHDLEQSAKNLERKGGWKEYLLFNLARISFICSMSRSLCARTNGYFKSVEIAAKHLREWREANMSTAMEQRSDAYDWRVEAKVTIARAIHRFRVLLRNIEACSSLMGTDLHEEVRRLLVAPTDELSTEDLRNELENLRTHVIVMTVRSSSRRSA